MGKTANKPFCILTKRQQRRRLNKYLETDLVQNPQTEPCVSSNIEEVITVNDHKSISNSTNITNTVSPTNDNTSSFLNTNICYNEPLHDIGVEELINDFADEKKQEEKVNLASDLQSWVIESGLALVHVNRLLRILIRHGHNELPTDCRSLLQTPRVNHVIQMNSGIYHHFGIKKMLLRSAQKNFCKDNMPNEILLNVNIDGLPLVKNSSSQFWPILAQIFSDEQYIQPIAIGIYHGMTKPKDVNQFLKYFVDEMILLHNEKLILYGKEVNVKIRCIICDAPARAFISRVKQFNGYFGCHKCTQEGEYIDGRMTFPEINSALRTDMSFRNRVQEEHHKAASVLELYPIGMVSQLPLDYLHLICIGVVKRLLLLWIRGPKNVRLNQNQLNNISQSLISLKSSVTSEFQRKPRSLLEIDHWKATEFRQFLLYTGVIALHGNMSTSKYVHFLSLHAAIRILCSKNYHTVLNNYAQLLLENFVQIFSNLYGEENVSYNVHNTIHLASDVKKFGVLDNFSSFPFENFLQKIKSKLKTSQKPLQQIINRFTEESKVHCKTSSVVNYPIITYSNKDDEVKSIEITAGLHLKAKLPNNICLLRSNELLIINSISTATNGVFLQGDLYSELHSLYKIPFESENIKIFKMSTKLESKKVKISLDQILYKCLKCPFSSDEVAVIPLIHTHNI